MRTVPALEALWRNLRLGARSLAKSKTMAAAIIATLTLGIGATSAIFSIVNGVLLKPLAYPDPDRLIALVHSAPGLDSADKPSAPFLYFTYKELSKTLEANGLWARWPSAVTGLAEPEKVPSILVTSEMLPLLGVKPLVGRTFSNHDGQPGAPRTIVLSYGYWQRRFAGDRSVIGQRLIVDGQPWEVIGVMPREFRFLDEEAALFRPLQFDRANIRLGFDSFQGIARLKSGVTMEQAAADIQRMIPIAIDSFPPASGSSRAQYRQFGLTPNLRLLKTQVVGPVSRTLWILMGTVGLLLLIACANVANLFLVRTEGRQQELSIRAALGAGRFQIARELLIESLLLGGTGGVLGLGLAYGGLRWMLSRVPANLPRMEGISIDFTVLGFTAGIALFTSLLFGILPMLRFGAPQPALRGAGRSVTANRDAQRTRGVLVIVQVALALVLMIGSGLMLRTFQALNSIDPGFTEPDDVQTIGLLIPETQVPDPEQTTRMMNQIIARLSAIPGVQVAAFGSEAPLVNGSVGSTLFVDGVPAAANQLPPSRRVKFISPRFFASLGTSLLAGRDLEWVDYYDRRPVALVSASLARELWGSAAAALGKRIRTSPADPWREIVGVAGDVVANELNQSPPATAYFPTLMDHFWGRPTRVWRGGNLTIRTPRAGTEGFLTEVQSAIWSVSPNLPLADVRTLGDLYRQSLRKTSFVLALLGIAGIMALLLGIVGIYGVVSYAVSQRAREIGIRLALGASPAGVRLLFTRQAVGLIAIGTVMGLATAFGLTRLMDSLLFGVTPLDPATFLLAPALVSGIAIVASHLPARRALRVDPMEALRDD